MTTSSGKRLEHSEKLNTADWKLFPTCGQHNFNCGCLKPCIRTSVVKDWMRRKEPGSNKTNGVLLFEEIEPVESRPHPSPSTILESCTIVFSWLLGATLGELIHIFYNAGIDDAKLGQHSYSLEENKTLREELLIYKKWDLDAFENLIADLERSRWEFCPVHLDLNLDDIAFGNRLYLPFCRQRGVAEQGGTADVYIAQIQEEFVSENMKQYLGPSVEDRKYGKVRVHTFSAKEYWMSQLIDCLQCYRLAIKRLRGSRLKIYNQERRAFKGIRDKPGMLRCLGFYSFAGNEHDGDEKYNILLEYADLNLHEFFTGSHPPQLAEEIYSQWKDFCRIAEAIETLHAFEYDEARWSGWHGDLKPKNLLLVGGEWKIADYGFAVFRPRGSDDSPTTPLEECTQTWGAPETVRASNPVLQTVDTWSFGCVLSIAATWMVKGNKGVLEYQEYRSQIAKKVRHEDHPPDAFHDGIDVLPHIRVWHAHLKQLIRQSDHVTHEILRVVDDELLLKKERLTSKQLRLRLNEILDRTENLSTSVPPSASSLDKELLNFLKASSSQSHKSPNPQANDSAASQSLAPADTSSGHVGSARQPVMQPPESPIVNGHSQIPTFTSPGGLSRVPNITETILPGSGLTVAVLPPIESFDQLQPTRSARTDDSVITAALSGPTVSSSMNRDRNHSLTSSQDQQSLDRRPNDSGFRNSSSSLGLLAPVASKEDAATMKHVWDAVEKFDGGAFSLRGFLSLGKFWIAGRINERNETPIMVAARYYHLEAVNLLVKHSDLSSRDQEDQSLLHHFIRGSHGKGETTEFLETLERILAHRPRPGNTSSWINWPDKNQHTCLFFCATFGKPKAAERLLDHCPQAVNGPGNSAGSAPLLEAMFKGHDSVAEVLVTRGASLEHQEKLRKYKDFTPGAWRTIEKKLRESQPQTSRRGIIRGVFRKNVTR